MGRDHSSNSLTTPGTHGHKINGSGDRNEETRFSGKAGKVRLSRSSLFKKKPYDRPISSGQHGAISLPARLVDTASNALVSSASYLFEMFFKRRRTLWIGNGAGTGPCPPGNDVTCSQHVGGLQNSTANKSDAREPSGFVESAVDGSCRKAEGEDLDLAQVERVLRRQILSRDQVNRLTNVLKASVDRSEGQVQTKAVEKSGVDVNPVQLAKAYMGECTLHMGGTEPSKPSTPLVQSPSLGMKDEVLKRGSAHLSRAYGPAVNSINMLKRRLIADEDDMSMSREPVRRVRQKLTLNTSPYLRQISAASGLSWTPVKSLLQPGGPPEKVSNALDKPVPSLKGKSIEEPWPAIGPSVTEEPPESSKARETLEVAATCAEVASPEKELLGIARSIDPTVPPDVGDLVNTTNNNVKPGKGPLAATSEVPILLPQKTKGFHLSAFFEESSSDEEPELPARVEPSREVLQSGGLATNVDKKQPLDFLSNSEKPPSSVNISAATSLPFPMQSSVTTGLSSITDSSSAVMISSPLGSNSLPTMSLSVLPPAAEKPPPQFLGPFPASAHLSSATEKGSEPINGSSASSLLAPALSMPPSSGSLAAFPAVGSLFHTAVKDALPCEPEAASITTTAVAAATSPQPPSRPAVIAAMSTPAVVEAKSAVAVVASPSAPASFAGKVVATEASNVQSFAALSQPVSIAAPAEAASRQEQENTTLTPSGQTIAEIPEVSLAASGSQVGTTASNAASGSLFKTATPPAGTTVAMPAMVLFGKGAEPAATPVSVGAPPDRTTLANGFTKAGNQGAFVHESPGVDKMAEVDTMATDPMTEELDAPALPPPAPAFTFGSASTVTSTGTGQSPLFGSGSGSAPTPSPISFPPQSSAASVSSSSSLQFSFGAQSSTPAGQLFGFGTSGSSSASSFSADTKPAFPFGSSGAGSSSSILHATSSPSLTFPATSATPSPSLTFPATSATPSPFAFGAQVSSASPFGAQMAPAANATSSSVFSFAASSASSGPTSFQFGVSGTGTPMPSSQPFAFGTQPTPAPANPFAQSGTSNTLTPFQFGPSPAQTQAVFPSGANALSSTPSPFAFGSQQPATPAPFTFGGQAGGQPSAQPFGFGGQPSAASSAQNPFASPASSGQNPFAPPPGASGMEFAGGFSLGAAGGEKVGRKFIKAKRIGGSKRK